MPFTSRFNRSMETELQKHLVFTSSVERKFDEDGVRVTFIKVSLRNASLATLNDLRGTICPTSCTAFKRLWFRIRSLEPRQEVELAMIPARIYQTTTADALATVDFSSEAKMSFRFSESGRYLKVAAPTTVPTAKPAAHRERMSARCSAPLKRSIPVSP